MTAPAFSKLLRQNTKFPADWVASDIFATSFARVVFRKNDVIDSIADSEDPYQYTKCHQQQNRFVSAWLNLRLQ